MSMKMDETSKWLMGYISKKGDIPGQNAEEKMGADIFDGGLIDSFGVIEMINDMESHFGINFRPENMQDSRFRTINGISMIIMELKG